MLWKAIPVVEARRELWQRQIKSKLSPQRLKALLILNGESEDAADRQAAELLAHQIRQETEASRVQS